MSVIIIRSPDLPSEVERGGRDRFSGPAAMMGVSVSVRKLLLRAKRRGRPSWEDANDAEPESPSWLWGAPTRAPLPRQDPVGPSYKAR
jgi:hypothetical protein